MNAVLDTSTVVSDGVRLAVRASGPRDAPPIVLVHGYPDSAAVWEPIRAQLDGQFRVIAYDVRGAGASEAPAHRAGYRLPQLAADLARVAEATCGTRPFHLVGHDWGSLQSWEAVTEESLRGRIASFTSISGPCLDHAAYALRGDGATTGSRGTRLMQLLKSWYIAFFHLPFVPELAWRVVGVRAWPLWIKLTEGIRVEVDPALLRNAVNGLELYRANFIERMRKPRPRHAHAPVQFVVPRHDRYIGPGLSIGLERWLGAYTRVEVDAGHWVVLRNPDLIARHIRNFVRAHEFGTSPGETLSPPSAGQQSV
ncbi:alpha/beta fold hydrolase [Trinickia fusca]|uniref:Alpha/beta fold hydrolase n=1 Tax=Trinickia fusca TaxID=2419777 RepID=A0A494XAS7_9BURK|nr:alpha/beta fold hydrolase [Trinickia fusca]RKP45214.1 alpha/beta fold hydrolase [Trinickia fusca]